MKVLGEFNRDVNVRVFGVINTVNYDCCDNYGIKIVEVTENELNDDDFDIMGWKMNERYPLYNCYGQKCTFPINGMGVNDIVGSEDYEGAFLIRLQ